jgi:hypothetical protein
LIAALKDKDSRVRESAAFALEGITGTLLGNDQVRWEKWWEQNKDKILNDK